MTDARITSKGQITIPKDVRDDLGLRTGDHVSFEKDDGGYRLAKQILEKPFDKWRGFLIELAGRSSDDIVDEMRGR